MRIYKAPMVLSSRPFLFAGSSWHNVSLRLKVSLFFYKRDIRDLFYWSLRQRHSRLWNYDKV